MPWIPDVVRTAPTEIGLAYLIAQEDPFQYPARRAWIHLGPVEDLPYMSIQDWLWQTMLSFRSF